MSDVAFGRIAVRLKDPQVQREIEHIWQTLQDRKATSANLDLKEVSKAIGESMQDGQLGPLERFLQGKTPGTKLTVQSTLFDGPGLIINRAESGGTTEVPGDAMVLLSTAAETGEADALLLTDEEANYRAKLTAQGTWEEVSSESVKQDFRAIPPDEILGKLLRLRVQEYAYRKRPTSRYVGPTAEDFHALFGLGDAKGIAPKNLAGVALRALQCVTERLLALEARVKELEAGCQAS